MVITENQERIGRWLSNHLNSEYKENRSYIGYEINGKIVAATGYDQFNGVSVMAHIAISGYAGKEFYRFIFDYPFDQLKAKKIIAPIVSSNKKAINIVKKFGFVVESVIKNAHKDGDFMFLTMTKNQCKILSKSSNLDDNKINLGVSHYG